MLQCKTEWSIPSESFPYFPHHGGERDIRMFLFESTQRLTTSYFNIYTSHRRILVGDLNVPNEPEWDKDGVVWQINKSTEEWPTREKSQVLKHSQHFISLRSSGKWLLRMIDRQNIYIISYIWNWKFQSILCY